MVLYFYSSRTFLHIVWLLWVSTLNLRDLMTGIREESDRDIDGDDDDDNDLSDLEGAPKRCRLARKDALRMITCIWPQFSGPSQYELALVWPTSLCELIAAETNRYAQQNNRPKWEAYFSLSTLDMTY